MTKKFMRHVSIMIALVMLFTIAASAKPLPAYPDYAKMVGNSYKYIGFESVYLNALRQAVEFDMIGKNEYMDDGDMVTRAVFVTMMYAFVNGQSMPVDKQEAYKTAGKLKFTDTPKEWFYPYIAWGTELGIIGGLTAETFGPNQRISRTHAFQILINVLGSKNDKEGVTVKTYETDILRIANSLNLIRKLPFKDPKYITRGEIAVLCYYAMDSKYITSYDSKNLRVMSADTWMKGKFGYSITTGVVLANEMASIDPNRKIQPLDKMQISGSVFPFSAPKDSTLLDRLQLLGKEVRFYVKTNADGTVNTQVHDLIETDNNSVETWTYNGQWYNEGGQLVNIGTAPVFVNYRAVAFPLSGSYRVVMDLQGKVRVALLTTLVCGNSSSNGEYFTLTSEVDSSTILTTTLDSVMLGSEHLMNNRFVICEKVGNSYVVQPPQVVTGTVSRGRTYLQEVVINGVTYTRATFSNVTGFAFAMRLVGLGNFSFLALGNQLISMKPSDYDIDTEVVTYAVITSTAPAASPAGLNINVLRQNGSTATLRVNTIDGAAPSTSNVTANTLVSMKYVNSKTVNLTTANAKNTVASYDSGLPYQMYIGVTPRNVTDNTIVFLQDTQKTWHAYKKSEIPSFGQSAPVKANAFLTTTALSNDTIVVMSAHETNVGPTVSTATMTGLIVGEATLMIDPKDNSSSVIRFFVFDGTKTQQVFATGTAGVGFLVFFKPGMYVENIDVVEGRWKFSASMIRDVKTPNSYMSGDFYGGYLSKASTTGFTITDAYADGDFGDYFVGTCLLSSKTQVYMIDGTEGYKLEFDSLTPFLEQNVRKGYFNAVVKVGSLNIAEVVYINRSGYWKIN